MAYHHHHHQGSRLHLDPTADSPEIAGRYSHRALPSQWSLPVSPSIRPRLPSADHFLSQGLKSDVDESEFVVALIQP